MRKYYYMFSHNVSLCDVMYGGIVDVTDQFYILGMFLDHVG